MFSPALIYKANVKMKNLSMANYKAVLGTSTAGKLVCKDCPNEYIV